LCNSTNYLTFPACRYIFKHIIKIYAIIGNVRIPKGQHRLPSIDAVIKYAIFNYIPAVTVDHATIINLFHLYLFCSNYFAVLILQHLFCCSYFAVLILQHLFCCTYSSCTYFAL